MVSGGRGNVAEAELCLIIFTAQKRRLITGILSVDEK